MIAVTDPIATDPNPEEAPAVIHILLTPRPIQTVDHLVAEGWNAYTPRLILPPRKPGQEPICKALYDGYAFVTCSPIERPAILAKAGKGARWLQRADGTAPAVLPDGALDHVRAADDAGAFNRTASTEIRVRRGDIVRWRDQIATVIKLSRAGATIDTGHRKLSVSPSDLQPA